MVFNHLLRGILGGCCAFFFLSTPCHRLVSSTPEPTQPAKIILIETVGSYIQEALEPLSENEYVLTPKLSAYLKEVAINMGNRHHVRILPNDSMQVMHDKLYLHDLLFHFLIDLRKEDYCREKKQLNILLDQFGGLEINTPEQTFDTLQQVRFSQPQALWLAYLRGNARVVIPLKGIKELYPLATTFLEKEQIPPTCDDLFFEARLVKKALTDDAAGFLKHIYLATQPIPERWFYPTNLLHQLVVVKGSSGLAFMYKRPTFSFFFLATIGHILFTLYQRFSIWKKYRSLKDDLVTLIDLSEENELNNMTEAFLEKYKQEKEDQMPFASVKVANYTAARERAVLLNKLALSRSTNITTESIKELVHAFFEIKKSIQAGTGLAATWSSIDHMIKKLGHAPSNNKKKIKKLYSALCNLGYQIELHDLGLFSWKQIIYSRFFSDLLQTSAAYFVGRFLFNKSFLGQFIQPTVQKAFSICSLLSVGLSLYWQIARAPKNDYLVHDKPWYKQLLSTKAGNIYLLSILASLGAALYKHRKTLGGVKNYLKTDFYTHIKTSFVKKVGQIPTQFPMISLSLVAIGGGYLLYKTDKTYETTLYKQAYDAYQFVRKIPFWISNTYALYSQKLSDATEHFVKKITKKKKAIHLKLVV